MRPIAPRTGAPEITLAEEQEEYLPVTAAVYDNPRTLLTRWQPSDEERVLLGLPVFVRLVALLMDTFKTVGPSPEYWSGEFIREKVLDHLAAQKIDLTKERQDIFISQAVFDGRLNPMQVTVGPQHWQLPEEDGR